MCEDCDLFGDVDSVVSADTQEMKALMSQLGPTEHSCSVTDFVIGDNNLPFCFELDDDQWEKWFYSSIDLSTASTSTEFEPEEEKLDLEPPAPKIRTLSDAIFHLKDVHIFLGGRGYVNESTIKQLLLLCTIQE